MQAMKACLYFFPQFIADNPKVWNFYGNDLLRGAQPCDTFASFREAYVMCAIPDQFPDIEFLAQDAC
jgi:hypothetical protein